MVTFEELAAKFPLKNVPPFGASVVVPGNEFDPDWEDQLSSQGCRLHFVSIDERQVTLVQKGKKGEGSGEKQVYEPSDAEDSDDVDEVDDVDKVAESSYKVVTKEDSKKKLGPVTGSLAEFPWSEEDEKKLLQLMNELEGTVIERASLVMPEFPGRSAVALRQKYYKLTGLRGLSKRKGRAKPELLHVPWNAKDDDLLIELWKQRLTVSAIAQKIPGRSYESAKMRLQALRKLGRIEPRWTQKRGKKQEKLKKSEQSEQSEQSEILTSIPTSIPTQIPTHAPTEPPVKEDPALTLLKEIRDLFTKQSEPELVTFETYCRKCENAISAEAPKVWRLCPVCGEPLIIWNVEASA